MRVINKQTPRGLRGRFSKPRCKGRCDWLGLALAVAHTHPRSGAKARWRIAGVFTLTTFHLNLNALENRFIRSGINWSVSKVIYLFSITIFLQSKFITILWWYLRYLNRNSVNNMNKHGYLLGFLVGSAILVEYV